MKKILLLFIALVLLAFIGVTGYLYIKRDSLLAGLKPQLETIASSALGTTVSIGGLHLGLGLSPEVEVSLITLKEQDSSQAGLTVDKVLLGLDLMPLLSKQLNVTHLTIVKPVIIATKNPSGVEIAGLPKKNGSATSPKEQVPPTQNQGIAPLPINFELKDFKITEGLISMIDPSRSDAFAKLGLYDLSVDSALSISGSAVQLRNTSVKGAINRNLPVSLDIKSVDLNLQTLDSTVERLLFGVLGSVFTVNGTLNIKEMKGSFTAGSESFDLSRVKDAASLIPAAALAPLNGRVSPELTLGLDGITRWTLKGVIGLKDIGTSMNGFAVSALNGALTVSGDPQEVSAQSEKPLTLAFQNKPLSLSFRAGLRAFTEMFLEDLQLEAFGGTISGTAGSRIPAPQTFKSEMNIRSLQISDLMELLLGAGESPLVGVVDTVSLKLNGELGEKLKTSTGGSVSFQVKEAVIEQVNIAHEAFKGLLAIPLVADKLAGGLPPEVQKELAGSDTKIKVARASLFGENGAFSTNDLLVQGSFFSIRGKGSFSMNGGVDLSTQISFNESLSTSIVTRVPELKNIVDSNGEITFPLAISGVAPQLKIVPDTEGLLKLAAKAAAREQAGKLLDKALGTSGAGKEIGKLFGF